MIVKGNLSTRQLLKTLDYNKVGHILIIKIVSKRGIRVQLPDGS